MSLSYTTNIGVYVACKVHKVSSTEEVTTCSNPKCEHFEHLWQQGKFCSVCGKAIKKRQRPIEEDSVDLFDMSGLIKEKLHWPAGDSMSTMMSKNNVHYWMSNMKGVGISVDTKHEEAPALRYSLTGPPEKIPPPPRICLVKPAWRNFLIYGNVR